MSASISPSDQQLAQQLITLTEAGLPLVADPWAWIAERMQLSVDDTLALLQRLQDSGAIRRIAAVPNHYRLGYTFNGMTVWDVDDAQIDRLGEIVGNLTLSATATVVRACLAGAITYLPWCMARMLSKLNTSEILFVINSVLPAVLIRCWSVVVF